jgi:hypothetical protein
MKYLVPLVLVLSLGSAAFAVDAKKAADATKASPISDSQAKGLLNADANLKKSKHRHHHHHHKAAAKTTTTAPAATTAPDAAPATK